MKIKLSQEDLMIFMNELKNCESVTFTTTLESKLIGTILKEFVHKIAGKLIKNQSIHKIELDDLTLMSLNHVMPQLRSQSEDFYAQNVIRDIYHKINLACLSI